MQVHLVHDVLDKRVISADGQLIGRVDGIRLEIDAAGRASVTDLCIGGVVATHRIGRLASWLAALLRARFGPSRRAVTRIAWRDVAHLGRDVKVRLPLADTDARRWERWLDARIISRIPGGRTK
jgi:sporulation protein YlmC with PRC-barrel domain